MLCGFFHMPRTVCFSSVISCGSCSLGYEGWKESANSPLSCPPCPGPTEVLPVAAAGEEHPAGRWQDDASLPILQGVCYQRPGADRGGAGHSRGRAGKRHHQWYHPGGRNCISVFCVHIPCCWEFTGLSQHCLCPVLALSDVPGPFFLYTRAPGIWVG